MVGFLFEPQYLINSDMRAALPGIELCLLRWIGLMLGISLITACTTIPEPVAAVPKHDIEWVASSPVPQSSAHWKHRQFPGKKPTLYRLVRLDGRRVIEGRATDAMSLLRQTVNLAPSQFRYLDFSWKVPHLIEGADLTQRDAHDSPVRIVLTFDGDRGSFSQKNAMLSELSRAITGEPLPYATLVYVWCNKCKPAEVLVHPRVDRIREIPLESGPENLGRWMNYRRNVHLDFMTAFGEAPGALLDVSLMTDADNTHQKALGWYGPVSLSE